MSHAEARAALADFEKYQSCTVWSRVTGIPRQTLDARRSRAQQVLREAERPVIHEAPTGPIIIPAEKPRVRVQAGKVGGTRYKVLAMGDAHDHPDIAKDRFRWMGKHAAAIGADYLVSIGDFATLDSLNQHISNDSLLGKSKSPFVRDMQSLKEALGELDRGIGSHAIKKAITFGNHERRAWTHEDNNPEVQNLLTGPLVCEFEDHGFSHTEYGAWWFLGGVAFIHAPLNKMGKTIGGETRNTILHRMVFDVVRGHDHQEYTQPLSKFGPIGHVTLVGLGCALPQGHIESYAMHALNGWSWGIKELIIQNGRITDAAFVSMIELEHRYG